MYEAVAFIINAGKPNSKSCLFSYDIRGREEFSFRFWETDYIL